MPLSAPLDLERRGKFSEDIEVVVPCPDAAPSRTLTFDGGNRVLPTRLGRLDAMQDVPGSKGYTDLRDFAVLGHVAGAGEFHFAAGRPDRREAAVGRPQDEIDITSLERARSYASTNPQRTKTFTARE